MTATASVVPAGTVDESTVAAGRDDIQLTEHEALDRFATGMVTALPIVALAVVCWQAWSNLLRWSDIAVFAILYALTALGITVGFHRHLTHRAFKTSPWMRGLLAILGSAAIEGPVISWVAAHRKHHTFSEQEGDPHSPHHGHSGGFRGAFKGLFHAHVGWLFVHDQRGSRTRYAPDLIADPVVAWVDRTFVLWVTVGLLVPFLLGWLIGGTLAAALTGLLWGGLVRMLVLHHVTYSINSLCHFFGRRRFDTDDESRNLAWLSLLSLGESWHHNHHAFPTNAHHGLRWWEIDVSSWVIRALRRLGLVWDVVEVSPERQRRRMTSAEH
jgi:stearoyl-CoA desaturase (Delta-9 desaturase)